MEKKLMMFLAALFLCVGTALAQTEISGTVISSEDKQPVVGASILVVGTQMGTVTDIDGNFHLTVPEGKNSVAYSICRLTDPDCSCKGWNEGYFET